MRLGAIPETLVERLLLATGRLPTPLLDTALAVLLARTLIAATRVGIFDALRDGPCAAEEVSRRRGLDPAATARLLEALAGARYLHAGADGRFALTAAGRWLCADHPRSLRDSTLFAALELSFAGHFEQYLHDGRPLDVHAAMPEGGWALYQDGMRSRAELSAPEVAWRTPLPRGARAMLDIGGAHGVYAAAFCRRHPALRAEILELPEAIAHSAARLEAEGWQGRIAFRAGDARHADLGRERYDLIFMANLAHHFSADENRALAQRAARALRPGGWFVVGELVRPRRGRVSQPAALAAFYFAVTSASGTWSFDDIAAWQRAAGLSPARPKRLWLTPGGGLQGAVRS